MGCKRRIESLLFSGHAVRQMFARRIAPEEVRAVIDDGEVISAYPDDRPFPSELLLGFPGGRAIHVVFAYNEESRTGLVVTVYVPDAKLWSADYRTRRKP